MTTFCIPELNLESGETLDLGKIKAKVLYILCDTDEWFPSSIGKDVTKRLTDVGINAKFFEVHSNKGHFATAEEPEKWVPEAKEFLSSLRVH